MFALRNVAYETSQALKKNPLTQFENHPDWVFESTKCPAHLIVLDTPYWDGTTFRLTESELCCDFLKTQILIPISIPNEQMVYLIYTKPI